MSKVRKGILIEIGTIFGSLTVEEDLGLLTYGKTKRRSFKCRCSCGNEVKTTGTKLRGAVRTKCMSCVFKDRSKLIKKTSVLESHYKHDIIWRAKKVSMECTLTLEEFKGIVFKDCHYCGASPRPRKKRKNGTYIDTPTLFMNGVDRVDNRIGYLVNNCVPCCTTCNKMKYTLGYNDFLNKVKQIVKYLKL